MFLLLRLFLKHLLVVSSYNFICILHLSLGSIWNLFCFKAWGMNSDISVHHRDREQTCDCQRGAGRKWETDWKFEVSRCKLLYLEWINNKVLLYSIGNCIQFAGINHSRKEYFKKNIYMCITELLCCTVESSSTLYINYISIKNKMTNISGEAIKKSHEPTHESGCIFCKCLVNIN